MALKDIRVAAHEIDRSPVSFSARRSLLIRQAAMISSATVIIVIANSSQLLAQANVNLHGTDILTVGSGQSYSDVNTYDTSHVAMSAGNISQLTDYDSSTATISGGSVGIVDGENTSSVTITGGSVQLLTTSDGSNVNISGGTFNTLDIEQANLVTISAGTAPFVVLGNGSILITGGSFQSMETLIQGSITLTGSNFSLLTATNGGFTTNNQKYTYTATFYTLSAKLENNATASTYMLFDSAYQTLNSTGATVATNGSFILDDTTNGHITVLNADAPEPFSLALLIVGSLPIVHWMRSTRKTIKL